MKKEGSTTLRQFRTEEYRIAGLLNFVILLSVAAIGYTDWIVVPNITLGYLYVLPIALCALINPLPFTLGLIAVCTLLQEIFAPAAETLSVKVFRDATSLAGFLVVGSPGYADRREEAVPPGRRGTPAA